MTEAEHMTDRKATEDRDEQHACAGAEATATDEGPDSDPDGEHIKGIYAELGTLPENTLVTEDGLAKLMGKACRESIKRAVDREELPRPVKIMGKNTWTVGSIIRHTEGRLQAEVRKIAKMRS